jgi:hypothetical protein
MKKLLLLAVVTLVFTVAAMAQGAAAGQSSSSSTTSTTTSKTANGTHQLTGCLGKDSAGNYTLTNGKYTKGVPVKTSEDLSAHVGHKVQLTGNWEGTGTTKTFDATSMKHISATCTVGSAKGKTTTSDSGSKM